MTMYVVKRSGDKQEVGLPRLWFRKSYQLANDSNKRLIFSIFLKLCNSANTLQVKFDAITRRLRPLCEGLNADYVDPVPVTKKVIEGFYNGISTAEIDTLAAETCAYMSQKHPDFSILAARIAISNLHKNTSDSFYETCKILHGYKDQQGRPAALLADDVMDFVQAGKLFFVRVIINQSCWAKAWSSF